MLKRQLLSNVRLIRIALLVLLVLLLIVFAFLIFNGIRNSFVGSYISFGKNFLFPNTNKIVLDDNKINLLLLGKGDFSHESPDLTDTIMFASISLNNNQVNLISIPRDIWIENIKDKINAAYLIGKEKQPNGGGLTLAKSSVEEILGVQIPYAVIVDFNSFKDIIDAIGGIEVDVKQSFTDKDYPIAGLENDTCNGDKTFRCRYQTVSFEKGMQVMNGERALIFVRSRHGDNNEGNDIAREARQQLVLSAVAKKIFNPTTFLNLQTDLALKSVLEKNIESDMLRDEVAIIATYAFNARNNIKTNTVPENLLFNPPNQYAYHNAKYDHAFVFIPNNKERSWNDVHAWIKSLLN